VIKSKAAGSMRLVVTRPQADAVELQAHLVARGHQVKIVPLLEISFAGGDPIELDGVQALIATSKNGLRALAHHEEFAVARALPVFVVGPGTAATARALGFMHVVQGPRAARDLLPLIAERVDVNAGSLLHLAGDALAVDVAGELSRLGFHVLQPVVYTTRAVETLPGQFARDFREGEIDGVLLLSPQTARVWSTIVRAQDLVRPARHVLHLCLSKAVAAALEPLGDVPIAVAKEPNLNEMLAAIDAAAANWPSDNFG
jgi:uroporphyrinogen-III synthase